jgi:hypothetical protein
MSDPGIPWQAHAIAIGLGILLGTIASCSIVWWA